MRGTPEKIAIALLTAAAAIGSPGCILDFGGLAGGGASGAGAGGAGGSGTGGGTGGGGTGGGGGAGGGTCETCGLCEGACQGGACQPLAAAAGSGAPNRVAVAGGAVYALDPDGHAIVRLAPDEAPAQFPVTARPIALAADAAHLVWGAEGGGIYRCALPDCSAPVTLAPPGTDTLVRQIALDAGHVYWIVGPDNSPANLMRCTSSACAPEVLVASLSRPHALAIDGEHVYWTTHASGSNLDGAIMRVLKGGGGPEPYLDQIRGPTGLALTATHVYFTSTETDNAVYRCARGPDSCGAPEEISPLVASAEHPVSLPRSIAVAGDRFYWTNDGDKTVMSCPAAGCATTADGLPQILAEGQAAPSGVVATEGCVFWAANDGIFGAPR